MEIMIHITMDFGGLILPLLFVVLWGVEEVEIIMLPCPLF
jgi:hypothetical protein